MTKNQKFSKIKVLDCTLRDGGYYNNWDFDQTLARSLVDVSVRAGCDIIEVGYRSTLEGEFFGLYRYLPESLVAFLKDYKKTSFAFMLDVKEFLDSSSKLDAALLRKCVPQAGRSPFTICRLATGIDTADGAFELTKALKEMGYEICFNIMAYSLLEQDQVETLLKKAETAPVDVFYFADSYGSLTPQKTFETVKFIRERFSRNIGVHTHENQGLAFANTLAAIDAGVDYVDATISGMGRGAGNLRLEQILLYLYSECDRKDLNPAILLPIIEKGMLPLQAQYGWGWDFSYMLSGLKNIHPTYCQKLKENSLYTIAQVADVLERIPTTKRSKFHSSALKEATVSMLDTENSDKTHRSLEKYKEGRSDAILILAGGVSISQHKDGIREFIKKENPFVIECNSTGVTTDVPKIQVVLNLLRLADLKKEARSRKSDAVVVTGFEAIPEELYFEGLSSFRCRVQTGSFEVDESGLVIPGYFAGMFAIGVALKMKPKKIYLVGFDGSRPGDKGGYQEEMMEFWKLYESHPASAAVEMISLLPTSYPVNVDSLYRYLD